MIRKVLTIGKSSYAITLPRSFIEEHNLEPGDELHVKHQANQLHVHPSHKDISVKIDLSGAKYPNKIFFEGLLRGLFLHGAQDVTITHANQEVQEYIKEELQQADTNFYIKDINEQTMQLGCPVNLTDSLTFEQLIRHSLQQIYKSLQNPELRTTPHLKQLNLARRALSQQIKTRSHLALYSFVETLEFITQIIYKIQGTPSWIPEYAHAVYLMQQINQKHDIREINKLCVHLQKLQDLNTELTDEQDIHAQYFLDCLKDANSNLLIAYG